MSDSVYTPEEGAAIATFIEALPSIVEERLAAGHRAGDEWIIGDLEGNPGTSCHVSTAKGVFHDHNPTASPRQGGAIALFAALFGYGGSEEGEALKGMVEWARGKPPPASESEKPDPLDELEAKWMESERREEAGITLLKTDPSFCADLDRAEILRDYERRLAETRAGLVNIRARQEVKRAQLRAEARERVKIERTITQKRERTAAKEAGAFWAELSAASKSSTDLLSNALASYRGLRRDVFRWMIEAGYLVVDAECQIAFPIVKKEKIVGMHVKWLAEDRSGGGWYCSPPGVKLSPLVIGDLPRADLVAIGESTWDLIAYYDLYGLYKEEGVAGIATRGAGNARRIPAREISPDAAIQLLLQNDAANAEWLAELPSVIRKRAVPLAPPVEFKDLNDWMCAVSYPEILQRLTEPNPPRRNE
jgi:hypothetical protein